MHIVGKDKPYYTQRNNQLNPHGACNVTSMVMALSYLDYTFPKCSTFQQAEDRLYKFILEDPVCKQYLSDFVQQNPWAKGIPPMQLHTVLNWATNRWMGRLVTRFHGSLPIDSILKEIREGRPVVISGTFPWPPRKPLGHIVVLVGYNETTKEVCYDDPYGETYHWDKNHRGKNIWVSWDLFIRDIKDLGVRDKKLAHIFFKGA